MALRRFIWGVVLTLALLGTIEPAKAQYNKDYFYWASRRCLMDKQYLEAIRILNTLLRANDDAAEGYFLRGVAKFNLDDLLGADADFSLAIRENPVFTTAYIYRALTRTRMGNYDDALKDFKEAIDLRPDLPDAYYSRGYTRLQNKQYKEAIEDFDRFIFQNNKVADAYIGRGAAYLNLQDTVKAMENFNLAIRTNRENPNGYYQRGTLYMQQNEYAQAEADFDMSIRCDSTFIPPFFNRAVVYSYTNRPMLALADFDHILKLDSTNSFTYFNRAILRSQIGDYNRALEDFDRVAFYSPGNVQVYYLRGLLKTQLGDLEGAEQDYTRAIELYPDFANAYLNRSALRYALRNPKGARRDEEIGQKKIAEYKAHLQDSTYSFYSDSLRMSKLLSFDNQFTNNFFDHVSEQSNVGQARERMLGLFRFSLMQPDSNKLVAVNRYTKQRVEDFKKRMGNPYLVLTNRPTNLSADSLGMLDRQYAEALRLDPDNWQLAVQHGITQSLIRQFTNSVSDYTTAILRNPTNPFLYLNRAVTRVEMIDFISSLDNPYQRISVDSDPAKRLNNNSNRNYTYDEAIEDLSQAIRYFPDFAEAYYNRGTLQALSGKLPEAFDDFTKAIELNPQFAEAYFNRGMVQIYMKDTRKGCLDLSKAGELGITAAYEILKRYTGDN